MDYLSYKVEDASFRENTPLRRAFRAHLRKVAEALHAIEWNDSGDGHDQEDDLILACIGTGGLIDQLLAEAKECQASLQKVITETIERAKP